MNGTASPTSPPLPFGLCLRLIGSAGSCVILLVSKKRAIYEKVCSIEKRAPDFICVDVGFPHANEGPRRSSGEYSVSCAKSCAFVVQSAPTELE